MSLISLSISKFSQALNDNLDDKTIKYTHIEENGMFLVIDNQHFGSSSQSWQGKAMKVMHGANVLEYLPLEDMCNEVKSNVAALKARGVTLPPTQRSIFALVRTPNIALRYRRPDGKIRRIQVRFCNDEDYERVIDVLRFFECAIILSQPRPSSAHKGPSCPPAALNQLPGRAIQTGGGSMPLRAHPVFFPNHDHILRSRPSTSNLVDSTSNSMQPLYVQATQNIDQATQYSNVLPELESSTAGLRDGPFTRPHTSTTTFPTYTKQPQSMHHASPFHTNVQTEQASAPLSREGMLRSPQRTYDRRPAPPLNVITHSTSRPATAPAVHLPTSISAILPPRRELPFDKPENKRPSSASRSRPPSGHPASTVAGTQEPARPASRSHLSNVIQRPDTSHLDPLSLSTATGRQSHSSHEYTNTPLPPPRPPNLPYTTLPAQQNPATNTPLHIPPTIEANLTVATLSRSNLVGLAASAATSRAHHNDDDAAKRQQQTVQDMICCYLRDDNFVRLCEEVEGEWRRVTGGF